MFMAKQHSIVRSAIRIAIASTMLALSALPSSALNAAIIEDGAADGELILADVRSHRHCHNLPKRTYCHKAGRLPQNWPPHTGTPRRGKKKNDGRIDCAKGSGNCTAAAQQKSRATAAAR